MDTLSGHMLGTAELDAMGVDFEVAFSNDLHFLDLEMVHDPRLEPMTELLLETFERTGVKATFFVLGFVARKYPDLIQRIHAAGHEIGCHSDLHERPLTISRDRQAADLARSVRTIEDLVGKKALSYRAPNFTLGARNLYTLELLAAEGIRYDCSISPIWRFGGGFPQFPELPCRVCFEGGEIYEFPLSVARVLGRRLQIFGGGYFRLAPVPLIRRKIREANAQGRPVQFYLHPFDVDGEPQHFPAPVSLARKLRMRIFRGRAAHRFALICNAFPFRPVRDVMASVIAAADTTAEPALSLADGRYTVYPLMSVRDAQVAT
jgi:polysaccharide deacetylase family protein (PEP-CTERM system associated)